MINLSEVIETNKMIEQENLDVRTITLGISLLDCISSDVSELCGNIYRKITSVARDLVRTGEEIEREFAIPVVNKRISVTPIGGAFRYGKDLLVRCARFNEDRHKHGCRRPYGQDHQGYCRAYC